MTVLWTTPQLAAATGGMLASPAAHGGTPASFVTATGISIDSRSLQPGDLFIALVGDSDGHAHVATALQRGAAVAMVHTMPAGIAATAPLLQVHDTHQGLIGLGRAGRARFAGAVIAVTGSVGKTTTKEMLRHCLSLGGTAHAAEASHNNHWGVPLTLARLPPDATACIVEIGMNHAGEIAPLSRLATPDVAVITTIAAAHVGHLGSLEAIADEKSTIATGLSPDGTLVLPADAPLLPRLMQAAGAHQILTFGTAPGAYARLTRLRPGADHSDITAQIGTSLVHFRLHAPGAHMVMNALAALTAAAAAGFDPQAAATALAGFAPGAGRGGRQVVPVPGGTALLLDESYNASAASIRATLAVLALQPATRRIAVLGDMLELGDHAQAEHRGLADAVAANADLLFTCGPHMRHLFDTVAAPLRGEHAADAAALAPLVAARIRAGDAILIKGSFGSRMRLVVQALQAAGRSCEAA